MGSLRRHLATIPPLDWAIALTLAVLAQLEIWLLDSFEGPKAATVPAALLLTLPLLVRRRLPILTAAAVLAGTGLALAFHRVSAGGDSIAQMAAMLVGVYSVGAYARARAASVAGAVAVGGLYLVITLTDPDQLDVGGLAFFAVLVFAPYAAGRAMAVRRSREALLEGGVARLEREREALARAAVAEERARIARELHDIVAHCVSVIVVQAQGGGRMVRIHPQDAIGAFATIESTGQQALVEMRRLLGLLRAPDDELSLGPQPTVARLDELVDSVRAAGLPVELAVEGQPAELPPGIDLSAYRIVQEALTNALKHAGPARVRVVIRYQRGAVELEISDDGRAPDETADVGHGLVGMRERVSLHGGDLEVGRQSGGGYLVRARLPLQTARP
jgi:signal transduction histidine kinase